MDHLSVRNYCRCDENSKSPETVKRCLAWALSRQERIAIMATAMAD